MQFIECRRSRQDLGKFNEFLPTSSLTTRGT